MLLPSVTNERVKMDESTERLHPPGSIGRLFLWSFLPTLLFVLTPPNGTYAQIVTNITATQIAPLDLGTHVDTVGSTTEITGGTRPNNGTNLFHSFDIFTLGTGDTAHFLNDMQLPTTNIFGRVIGGEVSTIDGILRTNNPLNALDPMNFGAANLWLVNPSGLLLGPNARVEVGGSVSMSTANYLRFFDGTVSTLFDMLSSPASLGPLSVAPVVAFGFLPVEVGATRGTISVEGSNLQVPEGQALSFVGGDITVQSGTLIDGTVQASSLSLPGGRINLVSVGSPGGEVLNPSFQTGPNIEGAFFNTVGVVTLKGGTILDVSGHLDFDEFGNPLGNGNSGTVFVRGGQLVMDASTIVANTVGAVDGTSTAVDIQVSQDVTLSNNTAISTGTVGLGRGGDVHILADGLMLENASAIITSTQFGDGVGGNLFLNVGTLTVMGGSEIRSTNFNFGTDLDFDGVVDLLGAGGNVTIQGLLGGGGTVDSLAHSVELSGGSKIISETVVSGDGGQISITAQSLNLGEASTINSSTLGTGLGGNILVRVEGASLSGGATIKTHSDFFDPTAAAGGTITVQGLPGAVESKAASLTLIGQGSGIISETSGLARLGDIAVYAKTVNLTDEAVIKAGSPGDPGTAGNVTINADSVGISGGGTISSQASDADAGQVIITADRLTLDNGSIVTSTSSEFLGRGGNVVLNVGTVSLTNAARINSQSGVFSTGRAGDITMNVGSLTLGNHAEITSSSKGIVADAGDAGNVTIMSSGAFTNNASTIATSAENAKGGDILIDAQNVELSNGTLISASSRSPLLPDGAGNAGNITINSDSNVVMQNSKVTTEASNASGGSIEIDASDAGMIQLVNSQVSTSVKGVAGELGASDGGNINIDPQFVILQNSQIIAQANAGSGGAINVIAAVFLADPNSIVDASSTLGISGTVNIQSPVQNLGEQLTPLTQQFSSAAALLAQRCAARVADGKFSTFVVAGREGLPAEPGGFLASPSLTAELLGSNLSGLYPHTPITAVTGSFPEYDARPIQLAKYGDACR